MVLAPVPRRVRKAIGLAPDLSLAVLNNRPTIPVDNYNISCVAIWSPLRLNTADETGYENII